MICESQYRQTADSSLLQIYFDAQFWTVQTFEKFTLQFIGMKNLFLNLS